MNESRDGKNYFRKQFIFLQPKTREGKFAARYQGTNSMPAVVGLDLRPSKACSWLFQFEQIRDVI